MARKDLDQETTQFGDTTSLLPLDSSTAEYEERGPYMWHGGADFGLLVLRIVVGGTAGAHGLQKIFGSFHGPGIGGFSAFLTSKGFTNTTLLAYITGWTEIVGGALLILGLLTPLAAAGVLGVMVNAVRVKFGTGFFTSPAGGYEYELVLAAAAFALMFSGAGRIAMDVGRGWHRKAGTSGFVGLILAAAATVLIFLFAHK